MSTLAYPIPMASVIQSEVDFVQPTFIIKQGGSLKSLNVNLPNSFSNSSITTKLEVSNTQMLIEKLILHEQPVLVEITGTTSTGINILQSGCQSARSHALAKTYNTVTCQFGSESYTMTCSDIISALERYNPQDSSKYQSDIDLSYLDQSQNYSDLLGSNRNPLQLYSTGIGSQVHRGTQPFTNIVNTPTSASFRTTFREYLPISPLSDQIVRMGSGYALTHLNEINITINFVSNLFSRMFSFMKNRNGDILTITSATVTILQPTFRFVQISDAYNSIPPVVSYPLMATERFNQDFTFPDANAFEVPSQVKQISRMPEWFMFYARPTNNTLYNGNGAGLVGAMIPDTFAAITKITITLNGQTLLTNSDVSSLYKMSSENSLVDSFWQFSGQPLLSECSSANGTYINGPGSVVKLMLNKDVMLSNAMVAPGASFRTDLQVFATFANTNTAITNWSFYVVLGYPNIIQMFGDGLSNISNAPITLQDVEMARKANNNIHYDVLRNSNIGGAGLFDKISSVISDGSKILPHLSKASCLFPKLKNAYDSAMVQCEQGGVGNSGGAVARRGVMKHNLLR